MLSEGVELEFVCGDSIECQTKAGSVSWTGVWELWLNLVIILLIVRQLQTGIYINKFGSNLSE